MSLIDKTFMKYWGFSLVGLKCKMKFIMNRFTRLLLKHVFRKAYEQWDWFEKPFTLRDCVFMSKDGLLLKGYDKSILTALSSSHEPFFHSILKKVLKENSVFIDVGAHLGGFTLRAAKLCSKGLVIALEPDPRNYYYLVTNIALNSINNVIALPFAAHSTSWKIVKFNISKNSGHSSTISTHRNKVLFTTYATTISLDNIVAMLGLEKVDAIKIDVEGAEVEVLKGSKKILKNGTVLLIEIHSKNNLTQCRKILEKQNYTYKTLHTSPKNQWHKHIIAHPAKKNTPTTKKHNPQP